MKVKKTYLVCCLLLLAVSIFGKPPQSADFPKGISLRIDKHPGWMGGDEEGDVFAIRCTFRNESKKAVTFLLADHSDYSGTLPYAIMLRAQVTDTNGNVLTRTKDFGDWWSSYVYSSDYFREMPGDRVRLRPGEKVVRIVELAEVLSGLGNLPGGLKAGEYIVKLRMGDIISNPMKLKVVAKK
jgi:hypothetical protein